MRGKLKLGTFEMLFYLHSMQRIDHQLQNFQFLQTGCVAKMRNTGGVAFFVILFRSGSGFMCHAKDKFQEPFLEA